MSDLETRAYQMAENLAEATAEHARIADLDRLARADGSAEYELRLDEAREDLDRALARFLELTSLHAEARNVAAAAWAETSARALR